MNIGTNGNDKLWGDDDSSFNVLLGYGGNDTLLGGNQYDELYGGEGNDTLFGGNGNDYLADVEGNDKLYGGFGDDTLYAGPGSDYLNGGAGDDDLYGYGGTYYEYDTLVGSRGADRFVLEDLTNDIVYYALDGLSSSQRDGYATITNFNPREWDVIVLSGGDNWSSSTSEDYNNNGLLDTSIYYGSNLIAIVSDTTNVLYGY